VTSTIAPSHHAPGSAVGLGFGLAAAAAFGTSGALGASLLEAGWSPGAAVALRISIAALVLTVPAALQLRGRWGDLRRHATTLLAIGALGVAGIQLFYFQSVQHLSVGVALLLEYSGVVLVVLWVWLRHKRPPGGLTITGCVACLAGLVLVLDVLAGARVSAWGLVWALAAAVCLAAYFVVAARADDPLPAVVLAWGGSVVGAVLIWASLATGIFTFRAPTVDVTLAGTTLPWWVPVTGLGVVAGALAYLMSIEGARRLGARLASFVGLAEVLFAVAFAWLLVGQRLTAWQLVGAAIVVAGLVLVRLGENGGSRPGRLRDLAIPRGRAVVHQ
jgi:drug/metabolite transporter (DMT)-like permease